MWNGTLSLRALNIGHHRQHAGEIALHVAGAAAVQLAVALDQRERIGVPAAGP